jgi:amidase
MSLFTSDAHALASAVRNREVSSRELLDGYLDRIDRLNPALNAVVTLDVDRARDAAAAADAATARGDDVGPLHGLPITIKDAIEVGGVRSTGGAVALTDHVPAADAPVVARLKAAGAIVFGKTNVPEWSGDLQTYNEIFGTTNNPWDTALVPGGSSGGPAAAVSAGLTSFEVGTDIGGSVRIPAHCCGVFGLKPSYGVVPQRGYLDHVGGGTTDADINVFGPLARSARDLDLIMDVIAGPEPERALAWSLALPSPRHRDVGELRVGVWFETDEMAIDGEQLSILRGAADALAGAGAVVEDARPPVSFGDQRALFDQLIVAAVSPNLAPDARDELSGSHFQWLEADKRRAALRGTWSEWFEGFDALLCPVLPLPAFAHQQEGQITERTIDIDGTTRPYLDLIGWTGLIGVVGLPSAVPPLQRTSAGVPVGVQVVTGFLRDREAIQLAGILADVAGGGYQPPPGFD